MGVVTAAVGVTMILFPVATATISTVFFGWCLVVAGVAQGIFAFSSETPGNFFLKLLGGILYVAAGLALAVFPPLGVLTLTAMIGWMLVLEGILEAVLAFALKVGEGRGWLLASAITSLALGVLILVELPAQLGLGDRHPARRRAADQRRSCASWSRPRCVTTFARRSGSSTAA